MIFNELGILGSLVWQCWTREREGLGSNPVVVFHVAFVKYMLKFVS
jgi:hypothetical protein